MSAKRQSDKTLDSVTKIGIDLGTTNSEVAINQNGVIEIIKNNLGRESTPSVFGIDKAKNKVVGEKAYDRLYKTSSEEEFNNNKAEVKRLMGTAETVHFERSDDDLNAEEISAEILKSLKEDISRKYNDFSTIAAVITIPAYFSTLQAEATKRAGYLAGFEFVVLLQEPIAAAMAYGFDNTVDENWLIYDLGGGTFDVALISSKEGILSVLGHDGNNFLGGKDFDNLLVDEVIVPELLKKFNLTTFNRSNTELRSIFARLKALAEIAKIELSQDDKTTIEVEGIGEDNDGNEIYLSIDVTRDDFEHLIAPKIQETIDLAARTIKESGVDKKSISRIVLVGGPTQIPFLKQRLEDAFDLKIDNSVDPLTVVARGACVYGMSQQIPQELLDVNHKKGTSEVSIKLNFDSLTADDEQTVTGVIEGLKNAEEDHYLQIQADSGSYTSSKIKLRNGKFFDTVALEKNTTNAFWVYLFDSEGNQLPVYPDSFSITNGLTVSGAPIPHTIGVIYTKKSFDNDFENTEVCDPFFERGSIPPLEKTESYKTNRVVNKGESNDLLIKIYEGESTIPDRNEVITGLSIKGSEIPHNLPIGTDIDITIKMDESRNVTVEAYLPSIGLTLNVRADAWKQDSDTSTLGDELNVQRERMQKVGSSITEAERERLEESIATVSSSLHNAENDQDEKQKADKDLKALKTELDAIDENRKIPQLKDEFNDLIKDTLVYINMFEEPDAQARYREILDSLEAEGKKAITDNDKPMLVGVNQQLYQLRSRTIMDNPTFLVSMFNEVKQRVSEATNKEDGHYYVDHGEKAIQRGDIEELKRCVRSLFALMPENVVSQITGNVSGISK